MRIEHWPVDPATAREAEQNYRTAYALKLVGRPALEVVHELTFDGTAPNLTISDIEHLLRWIERSFLRRPLAGVGIEVGAGPLVFSSVLARRSEVSRMYGVEICAPIIEQLYPDVARGLAGPAASKTVGVVGSFDEMQLPDASVEFVFDFLSLHHSLDIAVTLKEIARVLKPGGFLLMLDKARPDAYEQADLDVLMDATYGEAYYRQFGLDPSASLTRRDNGEREYRLKDWRRVLGQSGFSRINHWHLDKAVGVAKKILAILPPFVQTILTNILPRRKAGHAFGLETKDTVYTKLLNPFRKELSLIVAYRAQV